MTIKGRPILLLERLGEAFAAKKAALQHARETVIANQRLNSEIQKKQILLDSVANEMTAALANVITSLRLLEIEKDDKRIKTLLGVAICATRDQDRLIDRILRVFENDLRPVNGPDGADWNSALRSALELVAPLFVEKRVQLETARAAQTTQRLALAPKELERLLANFLENALERSAPGSAVVVEVEDQPEALFVSFEDSGPTLSARVCENLFSGWSSSKGPPDSILRLQFCRIVVENCGGQLGCAPLPGGGNRFWASLTKSSPRP